MTLLESQPLGDWVTWLALGIYFVGPVGLLLLLGRANARANLFPFLLGMPTFLAAWIVIAWLLGWMALWGIGGKDGAVLFGLAFSTLAGVVEESFRYAALRIVGRKMPVIDWRVVLAYAAGHAGGECVLVGITRWDAGEMAGLALLRDAVYHVGGALVVQACFTAVVFQAVRRRELWPLVLAMLWHFAQDTFGTAARSLAGDYAGNLVFIGTNFLVYPCLLVLMLRAWYSPGSPMAPAPANETGSRRAAGC